MASEMFGIKTTNKNLMAAILGSRVPNIRVSLNRHYNLPMHEYMGLQNEPTSQLKVHKLVKLQIREDGKDGDSDVMLCAYSGGMVVNGESYLAICDDYSIISGNLTMPAKLPIKNIVSYDEIETFELRKKPEVRSSEEIIKRLSAEFSPIDALPDRVYEAKSAEYRGPMNQTGLNIKPLAIAEFQIRVGENSGVDNMFCAYVGGVNLNAPKPFALVCDDCFIKDRRKTKLTMPARLYLEDIADFRIVDGY